MTPGAGAPGAPVGPAAPAGHGGQGGTGGAAGPAARWPAGPGRWRSSASRRQRRHGHRRPAPDPPAQPTPRDRRQRHPADLQLVLTSPPPARSRRRPPSAWPCPWKTARVSLRGFDGPISVELTANPGGATLGGDAHRQSLHGVATFSGLTLNQAGNGYQIEAESGGVTSTPATLDVTGSIADAHAPLRRRPPRPLRRRRPRPLRRPPRATPTPTPSPPDAHPAGTDSDHGTPAPANSKKGITAVSVGFNQPRRPRPRISACTTSWRA